MIILETHQVLNRIYKTIKPVRNDMKFNKSVIGHRNNSI
jgi:hypothetical protein